MTMYQLPIEIIYKQVRTQFEDNVYKAVRDYGIVVDKDELVKALQYDRGQYEKGYEEGKRAAAEKIYAEIQKLVFDAAVEHPTELYHCIERLYAELKEKYTEEQ